MKKNRDKVEQVSEYVAVYLGAQLFGLPIERVQDVFIPGKATAVPLAGPEIAGLINLRGRIVTAIDMRRRLGLPPRAKDKPPMNMVVRTSDGVVSLLVDEIGDVLDMDAATYERPPRNLYPAAREVIRGVYKLQGRLLLVLDAERTAELTGLESDG